MKNKLLPFIKETYTLWDLPKQFSSPLDDTKKLNLLIEFSNSIFPNSILKHVDNELAFKII